LLEAQSHTENPDDVALWNFTKTPVLKTPEAFAATTKFNLFGVREN